MDSVFRIEAAQSGGSVSALPDVSGNGFDFTPGVNRVMAGRDAGGPLVILPIDHSNNGARQNFGSFLENSAVPVSLTVGATFAAVVNIASSRMSRTIGPAGGSGLRHLATFGAGELQFSVFFDETVTDPSLGTVRVQGPLGTAVQMSSNRIALANVIIVAVDETGGTISLNGEQTAFAWGAEGSPQTGVRLGSNFEAEHSADSTTATFQIREAELFTGRQTAAEIATLSQSLINTYGIPVSGGRLVMAGDSIGFGFDSVEGGNTLTHSGVHLDRPTYSYATAGNTLFGGQRTLFDNYGPTLEADRGDILFVQGGSNDIAGGRSTQQVALDDLDDFLDNRVSGDWAAVVIQTVTPRVDYTEAMETVRLESNEIKRNRPGVLLLDVAARDEFKDHSDRRYFAEDGVHWTDLGYQIAGEMLADLLNIARGGTTVTTRPWTPDDLAVEPLVDIRATNFADNAANLSAVGGAVGVNGDGIDFATGAYLDLGDTYLGAHVVSITGVLGGGSANFLNAMFGSIYEDAANSDAAGASESTFVNYDNSANFLVSTNGSNPGLAATVRISGESAGPDNDVAFPVQPYTSRVPLGVDSYSIQYASADKVNVRYVNALATSAANFSTNNALTLYGFFIFAEPLTNAELVKLEGWAQATFGDTARLAAGHAHVNGGPTVEVPLNGFDLVNASLATLQTSVNGVATELAAVKNSTLAVATELSKVERSENPVEAGGIVAKRLHDTAGNITETIRESTV